MSRGDRIRTCDIQLPKLALYQAELHPGKGEMRVKKWWLGTGSNRRHADFQSAALPTELPSHLRRPFGTGCGQSLHNFFTFCKKKNKKMYNLPKKATRGWGCVLHERGWKER